MGITTKVATALGEIHFSVQVESASRADVNLKKNKFEPQLPEGMAVECATAVVLKIIPKDKIRSLNFSCTFNQNEFEGHGCSGQFLDAWEWESESNLVVVGTEDGEILGNRLKVPEYTIENTPVFYEPNKISIIVNEWVSLEPLSLHFIVAENSLPEQADCSCWFASDQQHDRLLVNMV